MRNAAQKLYKSHVKPLHAVFYTRSGIRYEINSDNFWAHVEIIPEHSCWEWTGAFNKETGYGSFAISTHTIAWMMFYGQIPRGGFICHRCDNRGCVRPEHLFLGTHQSNMADMRAKGRGQNKMHCKRGHEFTKEGYVTKAGYIRKVCKICNGENIAAFQLRKLL